ncbi:MAG: hypothetical protein DRN27_02880 [Thermoplasmata archaeon]|nr:MAG: hypothetical protein DRN27_02880 [Thermoplasmata archaeon]
MGQTNYHYGGFIDEVRISKTNRNASWINTCYNTIINTSTFISVGEEDFNTNTYVNPISITPVTYMPFEITSTGSNFLDNISLWYRYSTDNSSWDGWTSYGADDTTPWNWSFNFNNGTGYYQYYSIGNKSGHANETAPINPDNDTYCYFNESMNAIPIISLQYPSPNGVTGIGTQTKCKIWANDTEGDSLTVYWYENTTGGWVLRNKNSSVTANTTVSYTFSEFNEFSNIYWWKVAVNDTEDNASSVFSFTTESMNTYVNMISPYNVSSNPYTITATGQSEIDEVTLYYRWVKNNEKSIFEGFESGTMNSSLWDVYSDSNGLIEFDTCHHPDYLAHSGSNSCSMAAIVNGTYAGNELYTIFNFSGITDIQIDFWHAQNNDESEPTVSSSWTGHQPYDAVSFTNDGTTWYELFDTETTPDLNDNTESEDWEHFTYTISDHSSFNSNANSSFSIKFQQYDNYIYISDGRFWDDIYINFTHLDSEYSEWIKWENASNPDTGSPWSWDFNFPNGTGYYEFYSIGNTSGLPNESAPSLMDASCYFITHPPRINSFDLLIDGESRLNNDSIDVNNEYVLSVNLTDEDGWESIDYVDVEAWYDNGDESNSYNQTLGGNMNMLLRYKNTSGTASYDLLWPDDEVELVSINCSEMIVNDTTRIINFSFIPKSQIRWAPGDGSWDDTYNETNDLNSWNVKVTAVDASSQSVSNISEYGVYKYTNFSVDKNFIEVSAAPFFWGTSSKVNVNYSVNYDYNVSVYFEGNLSNSTLNENISIKNNTKLLASAFSGDDIITDQLFEGVGVDNSVDIFNDSGFFPKNNTSQIVSIQFSVFVPLGTMSGVYSSKIAVTVKHDT